MSLALTLGLVGCAFLFLHFAFNLEKEHFLLKLLLLSFFAVTILILPNAAVSEDCNVVLANSTATTNNTTNTTQTNYEYTTACTTIQSNAPISFIKITTWFFRIFFSYSLLFLIWDWGKRSEKIVALAGRFK